MADEILYRCHKSVKIGQSERFRVNYEPNLNNLRPLTNLWVKVKNLESLPLRAAFLRGPYILYVDITPEEFDHLKPTFVTAEQPNFESNLLAGQSFYSELSCNTIKSQYSWTIDVMSQILFNNSISIEFEVIIGTSRNALENDSISNDQKLFTKFLNKVEVLNVLNQDYLDLWNLPLPDHKKPLHLVILTHGLHSNLGTDMFYIKEQINKMAHKLGNNVMVKGYHGNVNKTERGIRYLGVRNAEYILEIVKKHPNIDKISFIGHSLGGIVQLFSIAYIQQNIPLFFKNIKPINFITLASPLLGISNENPVYVKLALSAGIVGKTGQDLGLVNIDNHSKPLLLLLPMKTNKILKKFKRRTIYANIINDGIVPLRTSALLYLDYKSLVKITDNTEYQDFNNKNDNEIPNTTNYKLVDPKNDDDKTILSSMMAFFSSKTENFYEKFQTKREEEDSIKESIKEACLNLPTTSVLESAAIALFQPMPSMKFIIDPSSRDKVVVHDKVYTENDLPPVKPEEEVKSRNFLENIVDKYQAVELLEDQIAREYHRDMSWRKVLVNLKPDAHNNIMVRRRFTNAYGWPVIDHLVENHFNEAEEKGAPIPIVKSEPIDITDMNMTEDAQFERESEIVELEEEDEVDDPLDVDWINAKDDAEGFFAVGPTGLMTDMNEMMDNFANNWRFPIPLTTNAERMNDKNRSSRQDEDLIPEQVMGGFY